MRYYDTAPHYGLGLSERRLGTALASRPREDYVLSTKVGRLLAPNPAPTGSDLASGGFAVPDDLIRCFDFSRDGVLRSLEGSLSRLGVSRVDIVYLHDPDEQVDQAITEALPALTELRAQGVIGAVGAGMNQWQALLRMVREADLDVVMLAGRRTLRPRASTTAGPQRKLSPRPGPWPNPCQKRRGRNSRVTPEHDHRAVSPRRGGVSA